MSTSNAQRRRRAAALAAIAKEMREIGLNPTNKADRDKHLAIVLDALRYLPDGTLRNPAR